MTDAMTAYASASDECDPAGSHVVASEGSDRRARTTQRTLAGRVVLLSGVLGQRDHGRPDINDARKPVANDDGSEHGTSGGVHDLRTLLQRLAGVQHVIGQQHPAAVDELSVEAAQARAILSVHAEWCKRAGWVREAAPAVEQTSDRVRQEGSTCCGTRNDFGR